MKRTLTALAVTLIAVGMLSAPAEAKKAKHGNDWELKSSSVRHGNDWELKRCSEAWCKKA